MITAGWAFGVFVGAFCASPYSGAHLNPAVTLAMAAAGKLAASKVAGYIAAQMLGGVVGGSLVFAFYREHFKLTESGDAKLACFCTAPNVRHLPQALFCEVLGTFLLIFPIFLMAEPAFALPASGTGDGGAGEVTVGLGTIGLIPVALLVFGIGLSLGGTTGYAINPARDLGPRLAHAFLPIPGKRDSDWSYAWVPVVGPLLGALLAAGVNGLVR